MLNKYTKHTYVVGLKKAYSQLQNAMKMIPITEGCSAGDYDCAGMFEDWDKVTNIDGQDFEGNNAYKATYLLSKQFKTQEIILEFDNDKCVKNTRGREKMPCFITNDGTIFGSYADYTVVDINGYKGPNSVGRDIFEFQIALENKNDIKQGTIIPTGSKLDEIYSGYSTAYWQNNNYCSTRNANNIDSTDSRGCTGRVLEEDAMNY